MSALGLSLQDRFLSAFSAAEADAHLDEPLAPKISIRVGGSAQMYLRPHSPNALVKALQFCQAEGLTHTVLGGGANTLVGDGGINGLVIKLPSDFLPETVELDASGARITLSAGASIARLIVVMKQKSLVGAEFLAGIPGTLGGAVTMNAGTKAGECMSVVEALEVATPDGLAWLNRDQTPYQYRNTELPARAVVTRVRFRVHPGDFSASQLAMNADLSYRKRSQPLSQPNFGSVFKNPEGNHAGKLIESVGLKGHTVGAAQISLVHANFIVNLGGATAKDVVTLMETAQARVLNAHGVRLHPEVKRVGRFI